jgi:hypothetical protein
MLIDQAADATVMLGTLCLLNALLGVGVVLCFSNRPRDGAAIRGAVRYNGWVAIALTDVLVASAFPAVLLGLETFGPLNRLAVKIAFIVGVVGAVILLFVTGLLLIHRRGSED